MSAWAELVNLDGSDEHLRLCNAALEEIQTQQRKRDAMKLHLWADEFGDTPTQRALAAVVREAGDRIHPEGVHP